MAVERPVDQPVEVITTRINEAQAQLKDLDAQRKSIVAALNLIDGQIGNTNQVLRTLRIDENIALQRLQLEDLTVRMQQKMKSVLPHLQESESPIVQGVASVVGTILGDPQAASSLGRFTEEGLEGYYADMGRHSRIYVESTDSGSTSFCEVLLFEKGSLAVIYHPETDPNLANEKKVLSKFYTQYSNTDKSRYYPDDRLLALHIDTTGDKPVAEPVVLLADAYEPKTDGRLTIGHFGSSASLEGIKPIAGKISDILKTGIIHLENTLLRRTPPSPPPHL